MDQTKQQASKQAGNKLAYSNLTEHNNLYWRHSISYNKIQCSDWLINESIINKWIDSLALYFLLKSKFRNSCLFNYKRRKSEISRLASVSPNTLQKRIEVLSVKGLVYFHANNLILKSIHKIKKQFGERHSCTLNIPPNAGLKKIEYLLYCKDLHQMARQQGHKAKRCDQRFTGDIDECDVWPLFSYETLAKRWNCSVFKVKTILDYLSETNVLKKQTVSKNYGKTSLSQIDPALYPGPGYPYISTKRKELIIIYGTTVDFLDYPLKTPKINDYGRN